MAEPVDELDVELPLEAAHESCRVLRDEHCQRVPGRPVIERCEGVLDGRKRVAGRVDVRPSCEDPVRRKDLEPGVGCRDEDRKQAVGAVLGRERDRGLVAVVAVRDEQLAAGEELLHALVSLASPEPRPFHCEVGVALRATQRRVAFVEQEDRLELDASRAQKAQPALDRGGVCALVGQDRARRVGLRAERRDDSVPAAARRRRGRRSPARGTRPPAPHRARALPPRASAGRAGPPTPRPARA